MTINAPNWIPEIEDIYPRKQRIDYDKPKYEIIAEREESEENNKEGQNTDIISHKEIEQGKKETDSESSRNQNNVTQKDGTEVQEEETGRKSLQSNQYKDTGDARPAKKITISIPQGIPNIQDIYPKKQRTGGRRQKNQTVSKKEMEREGTKGQNCAENQISDKMLDLTKS